MIKQQKKGCYRNIPTQKNINFILSQFDDTKQDEADKRYRLATTFYMANFYDFDEEQRMDFDILQRNEANKYFGGRK